jgi:hypothetical protein
MNIRSILQNSRSDYQGYEYAHMYEIRLSQPLHIISTGWRFGIIYDR